MRVQHRRHLHPGAWWIWAGCLAGAAMRTTNPILLAMLGVVVAYVVASRRQTSPWAQSFGAFVKLGAALIVFRIVLQMFFGVRFGRTMVFTLPSLALPDWAAGVSLGGVVTVEMLLDSLYQSLRLAIVLVCFGAVNALCSPYRLLRCLPAVLYEVGVVVAIALSFAPQTVVSASRVRQARRLRGRPNKGLRGLRGMAMPVLENALERSVSLAASMDARGYGRRGEESARTTRVVLGATVIGLPAVCVGVYGSLDLSAPRFMALPALGVGSASLALVLFSKGRHSTRTRYRADPWEASEWLVVACGLLTIGSFVIGANVDPTAFSTNGAELVWPGLPIVPFLGLAAAMAPSWVSPRPPETLPARSDLLVGIEGEGRLPAVKADPIDAVHEASTKATTA